MGLGAALAVGVVGGGFGDAVAESLGGQRAGGVVGDGLRQGLAGAFELADPAGAIARERQVLAAGQGGGQPPSGGVVGVAGGVGDAGLGAGLGCQASVRVVGVGGLSGTVDHLAQPADTDATAGRGIVGVAGRLAAAPGLAQRPVQGVVGERDAHAAGVGAGQDVAGGIIGGAGGAPVGALFLGQVAQAVVGVGGGGAVGGGQAGDAVLAVVGERGQAGQRVADLRQPVAGVVGLAGGLRLGVGNGGGIALRVVGVLRGLAGGADGLLQATQGIEHPRAAARHAGVRVAPGLAQAIAGGVQRMDDAVTDRVGDLGQPSGAVVGVVNEAAVRQGDTAQVPGGVVGERGGGPGGADGPQPAARVVGVGGGDAVGVHRLAQPPRPVVAGQVGHLAQRVGDAHQVPAPVLGGGVGVVGVGGDIGQVGARTVHGQHLAVGVPGVGPHPRRAGQRGGEALAAVGIGGGLLGAGQDVAFGVVGVGDAPARLRHAQRQAEGRVPLGADRARDAGHRRTRTGRAGQAFHAPGFEVARRVVGVTGQVAVEIAPGRDVAVGVPSQGLRGVGAAAGARLRQPGQARNLLLHDKAVGAHGAQRVGDLCAAVRLVGERVGVHVAGPARAGGAAVRRVGPGRYADAALVGQAGERMRQVGAAGVGGFVVVVTARERARVGDARQLAGGVVGVAERLPVRRGETRQTTLRVVGEVEHLAVAVRDAREAARPLGDRVGERVAQAGAVAHRRQHAIGAVGLDPVVRERQGPVGAGLGQAFEHVGLARPGAAVPGVREHASVRPHRPHAAERAGVVGDDQHAGVGVAPAGAQRRGGEIAAVVVTLEAQREAAGALEVHLALVLVARCAMDGVGAVGAGRAVGAERTLGRATLTGFGVQVAGQRAGIGRAGADVQEVVEKVGGEERPPLLDDEPALRFAVGIFVGVGPYQRVLARRVHRPQPRQLGQGLAQRTGFVGGAPLIGGRAVRPLVGGAGGRAQADQSQNETQRAAHEILPVRAVRRAGCRLTRPHAVKK
nr:C854 [uncultured bacterium]ART37168.1 D365 [uncultured bacterium]